MIDFDAIDISGAHGARTIVFLHAASYTRKMWLPQTRALSNEFRVIAIDLRGHGTRAGAPFDFDAAVDDVLQTLNGLGIGPALFVGASLGGCIAMEIARAAPESVAGMVLSGSSFDPRTLLCQLVLTGESIVFPLAERRLIRHYREYIERSMPANIAAEIIESGSWWRTAATAVAQMRGRDFVGALRSFDGPVLIVNGGRDWVHRFYERRFLAAARDGSIRIIDGGNHICSLDEPEAFSEIVREFARRCPFPALSTARE